MFKFMNRFRETAADIMAQQLFEAQREAVAHEAAAEHHEALAMMYRGRVERLQREMTPAANDSTMPQPRNEAGL
jgi:hypothetical protein